MTIKLIIFDLAGIILTNADLIFAKELAKKTNKTEEDINKEFYPLVYQAECDEMTELEAIEQFLKNNNVALDAKALQERRHELTKINKNVVDFIKKIKEQYKLAFATNNASDEFTANNDRYKITNLFHYGLSSHMVKARKTEPIIFKKILEHFNVKPEEVVFLDDGEKYLVAPKKLGINTIHYVSLEQAKEELKKFGIT
jgi:putative hydrolase of the HAD superfamily